MTSVTQTKGKLTDRGSGFGSEMKSSEKAEAEIEVVLHFRNSKLPSLPPFSQGRRHNATISHAPTTISIDGRHLVGHPNHRAEKVVIDNRIRGICLHKGNELQTILTDS